MQGCCVGCLVLNCNFDIVCVVFYCNFLWPITSCFDSPLLVLFYEFIDLLIIVHHECVRTKLRCWVITKEQVIVEHINRLVIKSCHSRLYTRPCRRRRPSSLDDGAISGLFSSGGPSVRFLTRYDGEVSEPLVGRQGSRVSMRVARGSASLLPSHGRGMWPRDVLKKVSRGLSRVEAGNPAKRAS